jgi:hypothetical protein
MRRRYQRSARAITVQGDVAIVPLTQGKVAIIDAADTAAIEGWNWEAHRSRSGCWYARRSTKVGGARKRVYLHRVILGELPPRHVPHHKDGDGLNNRRSNLCSVTAAKNTVLASKKAARSRDPIHQLGKISFEKRHSTWRAYIHLGYFDTMEEADAARRFAAQAILHQRKKSRPGLSAQAAQV